MQVQLDNWDIEIEKRKDLKQDIGSSWKNIKTTFSDTRKAFKKELEENKRNK